MLTVIITFHGPFHVGTGTPAAGLDATVDHDALLPASSLKGVMRAAAQHDLKIPEALVAEVFGDPPDNSGSRRHPSPWTWTDAVFTRADTTRSARIKLDERGRTERGFLLFGEQVWADTAGFTIEPLERLEPPALAQHRLLLRAALRAVTSVGAGRHRGQGWTTLRDEDDWTDEDSVALSSLIYEGRTP